MVTGPKWTYLAPNMLMPKKIPAPTFSWPGQGTTQRYCCMEPEPWIPSSGLFDGKAPGEGWGVLGVLGSL